MTGERAIRLQYEITEFQSETVTFEQDERIPFEFVLTETGAVSANGPHAGLMADVVEDIRAAWLTPKLGVNGLCWQTEPGAAGKLPDNLRTFQTQGTHRIIQVADPVVHIHSDAEVSLKLKPALEVGPIHAAITQETVLHRTMGPTAMQRDVKMVLHDPTQKEIFPALVHSELVVETN